MKYKNPSIMKFGKTLEKIRKEKGLSYRQLAQRCDVEYSHISNIEKGLLSVQLLTIFELAKGLGIHPKELFDFDININIEK